MPAEFLLFSSRMDWETQHRQLTEAVQRAREGYLKLNQVYDDYLQQAHEAGHGSQASVDALKKAIAIGPELTLALNAYRNAVESLARFYQQP